MNDIFTTVLCRSKTVRSIRLLRLAQPRVSKINVFNNNVELIFQISNSCKDHFLIENGTKINSTTQLDVKDHDDVIDEPFDLYFDLALFAGYFFYIDLVNDQNIKALLLYLQY